LRSKRHRSGDGIGAAARVTDAALYLRYERISADKLDIWRIMVLWVLL